MDINFYIFNNLSSDSDVASPLEGQGFGKNDGESFPQENWGPTRAVWTLRHHCLMVRLEEVFFNVLIYS